MSYIGKTASSATQNIFKFVPSSSATTVTGADAFGRVLSMPSNQDAVSVFLNGILLLGRGVDYSLSTSTVTFTSAYAISDEIIIITLEPFAVADMVKASTGGTFEGGTTHNGGITGTTATFSGDLTVDTDTLFVDVSQDNVGINTNAVDSDVALEVNGNVAFKNGGNYSLYADVDGALTMYHNGSSKLATASDGVTITGDIVLSGSGNGINLGVTSNTDANTLDDYEQGTFTPSADGFSGTISFENAVYVKIGQMVFFTLRIGSRSNTSDSSQIAISGFPFAVLGEHPASVGTNASSSTPLGHAMINTAEILYFYTQTGGAYTYNNLAHTSGYIRIQGAYRIV